LEVRGQLHASAALLPGKEQQLAFGYKVGWTPEPIWTSQKTVLSTNKFIPNLLAKPHYEISSTTAEKYPHE
jgi:hypothetical protein